MLLLQTWYNLSDLALEERVNDPVNFSRFLGPGLEDVSPGHSTLGRFRTALTELGIMDKLLNLLNKQLSVHHLDIREGAIIDASIVDSPHRPEGKLRIEVADDRGYPSSENRKFLSERRLKNGIMYKQNKGEDRLNPSKQLFNRLVSHYRYAIERTFGGIRRWFHGGIARYYGLKKTHTQNLTEAIAYNLYVTPGIIMRNSLKNV